MANIEREVLRKERVIQLHESSQSQRSFAMSHGYAQRQLNYGARRLSVAGPAPVLLPLSIQPPESTDPQSVCIAPAASGAT